MYIHTYRSRFIPEGVVEVSKIFLRDAQALPKVLSYEEYCRHDRWQAHRRMNDLKSRFFFLFFFKNNCNCQTNFVAIICPRVNEL
jgi:hypothetical protein